MTGVVIKIEAADIDTDKRLDAFLAENDSINSRAQAQRLIKDQQVTVNYKQVKASYRVQPEDIVEIIHSRPVATDIIPEQIPLDILFEDDDVIVINKAAGMVVHPAAGNYNGTLVNALLNHCKNLSGIGGEIRPGIVHRLDKGTTGVIVAAKNDKAHIHLSRQFEEHTITRQYRALIYGHFKEPRGTIRLPIGRHHTDRKKMSTSSRRGREAVTHWEVLELFENISLLKVSLETGRTHQVRVHLASQDHPIVNDLDYGTVKRLRMINDKQLLDAVKGLNRPMLHAGYLEFIHPSLNKPMIYEAPLPSDFKEILTILRCGR